MKVGKLPKCTNDSQSRMFAHAASSYWNIASNLNDQNSANFDLWNLMFGGIPIMHMALELATKAIVMISDKNFNPQKAGHNTAKIIQNYKKTHPLDIINAGKDKMDLIKELSSSWFDLRYAGGTLNYEQGDKENFDEIMTLLTEEYKKLSGLRTL